jgi:hypothetical protein
MFAGGIHLKRFRRCDGRDETNPVPIPAQKLQQSGHLLAVNDESNFGRDN